jgi:hypothetical protein
VENTVSFKPQSNLVNQSEIATTSINNDLPLEKKSRKWLLIPPVLLLLVIVVIAVLHFKGFGYKTDSNLITNIKSGDLINKENKSVTIKSVMIKNNFITPRKITLPYTRVCLEDKESIKQDMLLEFSYEVRKSSFFSKDKQIEVSPKTNIWLYPFSEIKINYITAGDWYDYVFQYLDYDELKLTTADQALQDDSCNKPSTQHTIETIPLLKDECIGCVKTIGGPDLSIIDFISNDNVIWEKGNISFVPIIKNVGDKPSGKLRVAYYLNGKHISSFDLKNLGSGEIINNFIAGSGFKGNFGEKKDTTMTLKVEVSTLESIDKNIDNNEYLWNFNYKSTPLPKHKCTFTDNNSGSEDFSQATTIQYDEREFRDLCIDENYLLEYLCDQHPAYNGDDNLDVFLYKCPHGCNNGACDRTKNK